MDMSTPKSTPPFPPYEVRALSADDFDGIIALADREIGEGYYNHNDLSILHAQSEYRGHCLSFVACVEESLIGFRLTLAPGTWSHGRGDGLRPDKWPAPVEESAYFQSCFIQSAWSGRGVGRALSAASIRQMKLAGIPLVVAHSWKESPHNSSMRYLSRLGFRPIQEYPKYWSNIDYECSLDGKPCQCTAIEVILELSQYASSDGRLTKTQNPQK